MELYLCIYVELLFAFTMNSTKSIVIITFFILQEKTKRHKKIKTEKIETEVIKVPSY